MQKEFLDSPAVQAAINSVADAKATGIIERLEQFSETQFRHAFNEATEIVYREQLMHGVWQVRGKTPDHLMVETNVFVVALFTATMGIRRGLTFSERIKRRVGREMLTLAAETGAEYKGKLKPINRKQRP
jgi:hypothetical protein